MSTQSVMPASAKGLVSPTQKQNSNSNDKLAINQLHQQFSEYGKNAREWLRKCALLLPEIEEKQVWRRKGFSSIYEYAAKLAGMSRYSVDEALRVLRRIEDKPALQELVAVRGIQAVRPVATIATQETAEFWAKKVQEMSKHTLETYVHDFRLEILPGEESQPVKVKIAMELDAEIIDQLKQLKGEGNWNDLMKKLLEGASGQPVVKKPEPVASESRYIPVRIKKFVLTKTGSHCAYPGCMSPYQILHHTQRFALEQVHDPDRLVPLCKEHERIAHQGLIANEEAAPERWRLLEEAEQSTAKYEVDKLVMAKRQAG